MWYYKLSEIKTQHIWRAFSLEKKMRIRSSARRKWNVLSNYLFMTRTLLLLFLIKNGNRTEWSPIRSVIIRVIYKIGRPRCGSTICRLITSMITDRIGRNEVLLPITVKAGQAYPLKFYLWIGYLKKESVCRSGN